MKFLDCCLSALCVLSVVSCGDRKSSPSTGEGAPGGQSPEPLLTMTLDGHPESIIKVGERVFISCVGPELRPTEKDGDGYLVETNDAGKVIAENAFPKVPLDAPKGMAFLNGVLYVADIDRIVGIDPKSGEQVSVIDLSPERMRFLNDLAVSPGGQLYASSTDTNRIYKVDPVKKSWESLSLSEDIAGPNGLALNGDGSVLYVAGYASDSDGNAAGRLWSVRLPAGTVEAVCDSVGEFDGIALVGDTLYFSDWKRGIAPENIGGAIRKIELGKGKGNGEVSDVTKIPLGGTADFFIDESTRTIWIPAMKDKTVIHAHL